MVMSQNLKGGGLGEAGEDDALGVEKGLHGVAASGARHRPQAG